MKGKGAKLFKSILDKSPPWMSIFTDKHLEMVAQITELYGEKDIHTQERYELIDFCSSIIKGVIRSGVYNIHIFKNHEQELSISNKSNNPVKYKELMINQDRDITLSCICEDPNDSSLIFIDYPDVQIDKVISFFS